MSVRYYDFGTTTSPIQSGWTRISRSDVYSVGVGYGWTILAAAGYDVDRGTTYGADYLDRDFSYCGGNSATGSTFVVDVPVDSRGDTYYVTVRVGDSANVVHTATIYLQGVLKGTYYTPSNGRRSDIHTITVTDGQIVFKGTYDTCVIGLIIDGPYTIASPSVSPSASPSIAPGTHLVYASPGTPISFMDSGGSAVITLAGLASYSARLSARYDRGAGSLPRRYQWRFVYQINGAPIVGESSVLYIVDSDGTYANGGYGVSDSAVTLTSASVVNLRPMEWGWVTVATGSYNFIRSGMCTLLDQYFSIIVQNTHSQAYVNTANVNYVIFTPVPEETQ